MDIVSSFHLQVICLNLLLSPKCLNDEECFSSLSSTSSVLKVPHYITGLYVAQLDIIYLQHLKEQHTRELKCQICCFQSQITRHDMMHFTNIYILKKHRNVMSSLITYSFYPEKRLYSCSDLFQFKAIN